MESVGLGGDLNVRRRLTVLRAIDKWDRLGQHGVEALLGPGRKDESGDFTPGAGLSKEHIDTILTFASTQLPFSSEDDWDIAPDDEDVIDTLISGQGESRLFLLNEWTIKRLRDDFGHIQIANQGIDELEQINRLCASGTYRARRVRIDPSVVRGLEYYTGPVYVVELTFPITGDDGKPVRFGSVAGGGRYDGLVARFRGEPVPATGFSIGVSRLMAALQHLGKIDAKPEPGPVVVTVFDRDRIADYQRMVSALRNAGIRAEMYLGPGTFGPQMKYADRRGSPCVVIQGGDEKAKGEVQVKDLILGATLTDTKDRDEYLKKQAEAQFAVPEDKLVDAVQRVLTRHGIRRS
jgi:histidyl-tRNA synthetase